MRLSGQDSSRGTFSTRHSFFTTRKRREPYVPLMHLAEKQARICIYNSLLSEAAVLGFDYGYSLDYPNMLCLWEAQFGDFANGAQTIIDQFIVSAESKWQRPSGIVLLLAARLRRAGAGTFQRAARAFPASVRRRQYPGLQSHDRRAIFSSSAAADETQVHQAAHYHDAEKSVARGVCVLASQGFHERPVRGDSRFAKSWTGEQNEAHHLLLGQSLLRPVEISRGAEDRQRGHLSASSNCIRSIRKNCAPS